ncbi:Na+/H+ antiporter subunit E [Pseudomonas oligotrophica]|uniref:Na+/H+ antiporter subunit E n=1 Tax=Pseudomonas oligotrophica TaxID=2912055 RepID=UPI001F0126E1|nr:Na+/H+ antiporter subunit E [Pseudomonas oligotrophica]MCF7203025.1 Na+/H+ antiporter subunit E [Pseudomonas oligotrophica]
MNRWLPRPALTLLLAVVWLLLANSLSLGQALLGLFLGWAIPLLVPGFLIPVPAIRRPLRLLAFVGRVIADIVVANLHVAKLVLGPRGSLRPAFVEVPVEIGDEFVLAVLTSIVSLTPGTVSAGLSPDRRVLLLHVLDAPDPDEVVAQVKARYEAPLLEIFACSRS